MADLSIRNDFIEGVEEIFETLFNNGEQQDGLNLYLLSDKTESENVYGEQKNKLYKNPVLLVCNAHLNPERGEEVEEIKADAEFKVPLKSLQQNNIDVTDLLSLQKAIVEFHGVFYRVDIVTPTTYVEDVFLLYKFSCTEDKQIQKPLIETAKIGK